MAWSLGLCPQTTTDKHPQEGLSNKRQAPARWSTRWQTLPGKMGRTGNWLEQGRAGQGPPRVREIHLDTAGVWLDPFPLHPRPL